MRYPLSLLTLIRSGLATALCRADTLFGFDVGAALANQDPRWLLLGALAVFALLVALVLWRQSVPPT